MTHHPDAMAHYPHTMAHHQHTMTHHPHTAARHQAGGMRHIVTGSRAERLNVPGLVALDPAGHVTAVHHSDLDILFSVGAVDMQCVHLVGPEDTSIPG